MTPHPHPHSGRAVAHRLVRRAGLAIAVALVVIGVPFVAQASDESAVPSPTRTWATVGRVGPTQHRATISELGGDLDAVASASAQTEKPDVDRALARVVAVLSDTYTLGEHGRRVATLQQLLGVSTDGWYGPVTQRAHLAALVEAGLLPESAFITIGPTPSEWAALRECEAGGDYSITNPSGKYRGAYQFDRSTWNSVAGRHDPSLVGVDPAAASPADQDAMALALYSERGARPWPRCGRHLS